MAETIKIFATSNDARKIEEVKKWLQVYRRSRKRNIKGVSLPKTIEVTTENIANYASVINTLLPDRRVIGFMFRRFLLESKFDFATEFPENNFNDEYYYLAFEKVTWHIIPTNTIEGKTTL